LLLVNITTAVSPEKSRVLVGKPEVKRPLGGVDGRIILRWIFRKWDEGVWTGSG